MGPVKIPLPTSRMGAGPFKLNEVQGQCARQRSGLIGEPKSPWNLLLHF